MSDRLGPPLGHLRGSTGFAGSLGDLESPDFPDLVRNAGVFPAIVDQTDPLASGDFEAFASPGRASGFFAPTAPAGEGFTAPSFTAPGFTAPSFTAPSFTAPS